VTDERIIVYESLLEVEKGQNAGIIGKGMLEKYSYLEKVQRAFMHCLYEGVIDKKITLDYVIDSVSKVPVSKMKKPVRTIIRMGAYQILFMDSVPDRAACNESVSLARRKHLDNLSGFINGVLRGICRLEGKITYPDDKKNFVKYLSVCYSMPELIVESIMKDYGKASCEDILKDMLENRPVICRTTTSMISTDELVAKLNEYENVTASRIDNFDAFVLERFDSIPDISEFAKGLFTVQDLSSQLVCMIAGIAADNTVIDVCAAPGGKSMHAADILKSLARDGKTGKVISCDVSEQKVSKILENIERLNYQNVETCVADATVNRKEFNQLADVVICDAPCSGLGVMARKRDIKYALSEDGLDELPMLQRRIIENAVSYVKPGGIFIYSTCTMRRAENDEQYRYIKDELLLEPVPFYEELPEGFRSESAKEGHLQLFAGQKGTDGFFISKFRRY